MGVIAPVTILGGLPVFAEVTFTRGDGYTTDDDAEVDQLYWRTHNNNMGNPLPQHIFDRMEKKDEYWQCDVIDQVCDWHAYPDDGPDEPLQLE